MKKYLVMLLMATALLSSCATSSDNDGTAPGGGTSGGGVSTEQQAAIDDGAIQAYFTANSITNVVKDPSGLYYSITKQGTGTVHPTSASLVTVSYTGKLLSNGSVFDTSTARATLSQFIQGWVIGLPKITVGGSITLYIPSGLAYGTTQYGNIPPNSVLIFTIDLTNSVG